MSFVKLLHLSEIVYTNSVLLKIQAYYGYYSEEGPIYIDNWLNILCFIYNPRLNQYYEVKSTAESKEITFYWSFKICRFLSRAEELQPRTFLPNMYHLGKTCLHIGQYYKAKYYLNLTMNLPPKDDNEKSYVNKAKHLIHLLERYHMEDPTLLYGDDNLVHLQTEWLLWLLQ